MRLGWHSTTMIDARRAMVAAGVARATHPAEPGGRRPPACERTAKMAPADLGECLVSPLHDPLRADVDPGARGHLAVHHEAFAIELVEVLPGRPVGTRFALAIVARRAACVWKTPTGFPDCTSSV